MVPGTVVAATLRIRGIRIGDSADVALSVALALLSGAAAGWMVTRQRRSAFVFASSAVVFMLAAHGPLPVAQSARGAWLALAFVPICLAGGMLVAAVRQFTRDQESSS